MPDLTAIFGTDIKVSPQPRQPLRQYAHFAGSHGLTAMHLGSGGYTITVTGRLRASGAGYAAARANLVAATAAIESYNFSDAADYTFANDTYYNVVFEQFQLVPDAHGKIYHLSSGYVFVDFIARLRALI